MRNKLTPTLLLVVAASVMAPTFAVADGRDTPATAETAWSCHWVGARVLCGSPKETVFNVKRAKAIPLTIADPENSRPEAPHTPVPVNLGGFHKAFEIQPLLEEHGTASTATTDWHGEGTAAQALQKILPTGWKVYTKNGTETMLSNPVLHMDRGKKPWVDVLKSVLKQAGLHGSVWYQSRILTLWPAPVLPTYELPPAPAQNSGGLGHAQKAEALHIYPRKVTSARLQTTIPLHVEPAAPLTPVFILNQGDLILSDLQKWAKQSGWKVVWQVPEDWQVPNTTTFSGDFREAVSQVIQALSANGANVHAVFHTANNTVVISGAGGGE